MKIDTNLFLDDFVAEAKVHIEEIESAFLDAVSLSNDPKKIDKVFRAAHSIKGTAGFFSLAKIVAVSHGLENIFSQIKYGDLLIDDEITDLALQSVDVLYKLIDNVHSQTDRDAVATEELVKTLGKFSKSSKSETAAKEALIPFTFNNPVTKEALQNAEKQGQFIYYLSLSSEIDLKNPEKLISKIASVGTVAEAIFDGDTENILRFENSEINEKIKNELASGSITTLDILMISDLEPELFIVASEIKRKYIRHLPFNTIPFAESGIAANETGNDMTKLKNTEGQDSGFSIRLDVAAINSLMDMTNEMILSRNRLLSAVAEHKKSIPGLAPVLHDMNRLTTEIQEKVMIARMQPISIIFNKFPRIIRNTAKALNKEIQIEISSDNLSLDKYLLDSLADPITQIVKNAADHGLENAERRIALNKNPKGTISLDAYMSDGYAVIEISDDGAGIDAELLKRKSIELGRVTEEKLAEMSEREIYALMFEPGISTAEEVTNLSGRGVGMDIVKTNIEKLKGTIEIDSETNKGTTIRLKIPLTLSAINSLIISIDNIFYAVPEINVERIVRIRRGVTAKRLERVNKSIVLSLDGQILPVVTMKEIEAKIKKQPLPSAKAELERLNSREIVKCLVMKEDGINFALLIDDAYETEQILINPLPVFFRNCPCYSNVTVLGNGNTIMILDAKGIISLMCIESAVEEKTEEKIETVKKEDEKQIIIFNCSGPEYFALETKEILRIETVNAQDIQKIGDGSFVNIAGKTIRAARPEDFVPVEKNDYNGNKIYLLTLKKCASSLGFLAGRVIDKVEDVFTLDNDRIKSEFIYGTGVYNKNVLIFLNPSAITEEIEKEKEIKKNVIKRKSA